MRRLQLARFIRSSGRALLFLAAGLAIAIPLVLLAARWASGRLSTLVWYVIWYAGLLLGSVPEEVYWAIMVLLFVLLAALSLIRFRRARPVENGRFRPSAAPVRDLASLIAGSKEGHYCRWSLSQELGSLVVDAVEGHRPGPADLRRRWLAEERPGVPPPIQAYVREATWGSNRLEGPRLSLWRRLILRQQPGSALDIDPVTVVEFIEEQLEVFNDHRSS